MFENDFMSVKPSQDGRPNAGLVCDRTYLHDFGVDFVELCAFVPLPAELLVPRVLFPE